MPDTYSRVERWLEAFLPGNLKREFKNLEDRMDGGQVLFVPGQYSGLMIYNYARRSG